MSPEPREDEGQAAADTELGTEALDEVTGGSITSVFAPTEYEL